MQHLRLILTKAGKKLRRQKDSLGISFGIGTDFILRVSAYLNWAGCPFQDVPLQSSQHRSSGH